MVNRVLQQPRYIKQAMLVIADSIAFPLAMLLALIIRLPSTWQDVIGDYLWMIIVVPFIGISLLAIFKLYREVIRYVGPQLVFRLLATNATTTFIIMGLAFLVDHGEGISRSVLGILFLLLSMTFTTGIRYMARAGIRWANRKNRQRMLIYGSGEAGAGLAALLSQDYRRQVIAFVDDNPKLHGAIIRGIRVKSPKSLSRIIAQQRIDTVLLALPSASHRRRREIVAQLRHMPVSILTVPTLEELEQHRSRVDELRTLEVEDLIGRSPVPANGHLLSSQIRDQNVMVTGAGGSIGSELCRQILQQKPRRLILLDQTEFNLYSIQNELQILREKNKELTRVEIKACLGSVCDELLLEQIISDSGIETLYHAAAYKHVPIVESNEVEGARNNVIGTYKAACAARKMHVRNFVLVSTDKAVRPSSVMGATKRVAELVLQSMQIEARRKRENTQFCMVRFGNVLGSSGSVIPLFRQQIESGGPITITHPEVTRYFMTIPEASELVIQAGAMAQGGDVFVLDMGGPVRIVDLARNMVESCGRSILDAENPNGDIELVFTGLRPGEKLYEELLIGKNVEGTEHPGIMKAREDHLTWEEVDLIVQRLEAAIDQRDGILIRHILEQAVQGYQPFSTPDESTDDNKRLAAEQSSQSGLGKKLSH